MATHNVSNVTQLNTALGVAVSGDDIVMAAGTYDLTDGVINLPDGVNLSGASSTTTTIVTTSTINDGAGNGCCIKPGSGSVIRDLGVVLDPSPLDLRACIGVDRGAATPQAYFTTASAVRCLFDGGSDSVYMNAATDASPTACRMQFSNCTIKSRWDSYMGRAPSATLWNKIVDFYNCTIQSLAHADTSTNSAIVALAGTVRLFKCTVQSTCDTASTAARALFASTSGSSSGRIFAHASTLTSTHNGAGNARDAWQNSSGALFLRECTYSRAKLTGVVRTGAWRRSGASRTRRRSTV